MSDNDKMKIPPGVTVIKFISGPPDPDDKSEVIFCYTRKQAIADGVLKDVSDTARAIGFRLKMAMSEGVFNSLVMHDQADRQAERLQEVLLLARDAIAHNLAASKKPTDRVTVQRWHPKDGMQKFLAIVGPDDNGEPVLTLCYPEEE